MRSGPTSTTPGRTAAWAATAALAILVSVSTLAAQEDSTAPPRRPDAAEVARRALILRAVHAVRLYPRAGEEVEPTIVDHFEAERRKMVGWLEREGLLVHATRWERGVLGARVGTLSVEDALRASEARESVEALLFALGLMESLPPYDGSARRSRLKRSFPRIGEPTAEFIKSARLRPADAINAAREVAVLWHWRARTRELFESERFPIGEAFERSRDEVRTGMRRVGLEPREITDGEALFEELVRFSSHWGHSQGMIPLPIDADFPAFGKAYRDLDAEQFRRARTIARARHRAFNWLAGEAREWDDVGAEL